METNTTGKMQDKECQELYKGLLKIAKDENHSCTDFVQEVLLTAKHCGNISPKMKQLGIDYSKFMESKGVAKRNSKLVEEISRQTCVHYNYWTQKVLNEELTIMNWMDVHVTQKMNRIIECIKKEL